jgi:hypothetical protein
MAAIGAPKPRSSAQTCATAFDFGIADPPSFFFRAEVSRPVSSLSSAGRRAARCYEGAKNKPSLKDARSWPPFPI